MSSELSATDPFPSNIDEGWRHALTPVLPQLQTVREALEEEMSGGHQLLPAQEDIFRAFTYPLEDVKVLIVGQDPYPTPGHAMGLAFSVKPGVQVPASLRNIYRELNEDVGPCQPDSGDLTGWSEQGVLLLNRVLTVRPGEPGSHRLYGWEAITERAIEALVQRGTPLVAVLWGKDAQSVKPLLGDTPTIASPHPSPLSAYRGFFGSKPFSTANRLLAEQGAATINWTQIHG